MIVESWADSKES